MSKERDHTRGIVADGRERVLRDVGPQIRAEVRAKYAAELQHAGLLRRLLIHWRMRRDIHRRLQKAAPREAHYAVSKR